MHASAGHVFRDETFRVWGGLIPVAEILVWNLFKAIPDCSECLLPSCPVM